MSADPRAQARCLATCGSGVPRHVLAALEALSGPLRAVCEGLAPQTPQDVTDALCGLLAVKALTVEQRAALITPLLHALRATVEDAPPRALRAVGSE